MQVSQGLAKNILYSWWPNMEAYEVPNLPGLSRMEAEASLRESYERAGDTPRLTCVRDTYKQGEYFLYLAWDYEGFPEAGEVVEEELRASGICCFQGRRVIDRHEAFAYYIYELDFRSLRIAIRAVEPPHRGKGCICPASERAKGYWIRGEVRKQIVDCNDTQRVFLAKIFGWLRQGQIFHIGAVGDSLSGR